MPSPRWNARAMSATIAARSSWKLPWPCACWCGCGCGWVCGWVCGSADGAKGDEDGERRGCGCREDEVEGAAAKRSRKGVQGGRRVGGLPPVLFEVVANGLLGFEADAEEELEEGKAVGG